MEARRLNPNLAERAERAASVPRHEFEVFFRETAKDILVALAKNPNLQERDLLRLLERKDLPAEALKKIAAHKETARNYSVRLALVRHPRTPRLVSLPLMKFLYPIDLVRVCQTPAVPADVKMSAEETILKKVESLPRGERITLARRGPGRVAASLLISTDPELIRAAIENPYLTEAQLIKVLAHDKLPAAVVETIAQNEKWSRRYHLRLAMLRNPLTPFHRILAWLPNLAASDLREICLDRRMPVPVRKYLLAYCSSRTSEKKRTGPTR